MGNKFWTVKRIQRALEILPGFVSWNLIIFPVWGAFIMPLVVAYFILAFDIFWFYKSVTLAFAALLSHFRMQAAMRLDWMEEVKGFPDYRSVHHMILIPTANEPLHTLERTIDSIIRQTLPLGQITAVIGFENSVDRKFNIERMKEIQKKYGRIFRNLFFHFHTLSPGEIVGKSSNERAIALWVKAQFIATGKYDIDRLIATSCDADHVYHPQHFAYLTFKFLDNPNRYERFWQPAVVFYNNYWKIPALSRIANTFGSIWNTALLMRTDRLVNQQNYSLSFRLLDEAGYWDPDIVPEDYRMFFKAFFAKDGRVEVEPIYLPLSADAAESIGFMRTMKNQYEQFRRWAWGVSDDPYIIRKLFTTKTFSLPNKIIRVAKVIEDHFLWPVNWFLITIGFNIVTFINPAFSRTVIGYTLPQVSSIVLTISLLFLGVIIWIDTRQRPPKPEWFSRFRAILIPLEFVMMPLAGFIFNALPGLDAHTRLMLGKYMEHKATEKV